MNKNYIRLFEKNATDFSTLGIGVLTEVSTCEVTEELNGSYELEMELDMHDKLYSCAEIGCIIVAKPNLSDDFQAFRIYKRTKPFNGIVTFYAQHISYDLRGVTIEPFTSENVIDAITAFNEKSIGLGNFKFYCSTNVSGHMEIGAPSTLRGAMGDDDGAIQDIYPNMDWHFDNFTCHLVNLRGFDNGVTIQYGKNMTDINEEEDDSEVYSHIYPFYKNDDYGYVTLTEKILPTNGSHQFQKIMPLDLTSYFDEEEEQGAPTEDRLREVAQAYIEQTGIGIPSVSITVSFEMLSQSSEFQNPRVCEEVSLGDLVHVQYPKLGVTAYARCVKTVYNVLTERLISVDVGKTTKYVTDSIAETNSLTISRMGKRSPLAQALKEIEDIKIVTVDTQGLMNYIDSKYTGTNANIAAAISSANGYTDTALTNSKSYTDKVFADAQKYTDDQVLGGRNYTDDAIESVKSYTVSEIESATQKITGNQGGYVVIGASSDGTTTEILIMDEPDITKATKVWRWNQGGLGFSNNGYDGPYTTAITSDGHIVADFITSGIMSADRIRGGVLTLGGDGNMNGYLDIRDRDGNVCVIADKDGVEGNVTARSIKSNLNWTNSKITSDGIVNQLLSIFGGILSFKATGSDDEELYAGTFGVSETIKEDDNDEDVAMYVNLTGRNGLKTRIELRADAVEVNGYTDGLKMSSKIDMGGHNIENAKFKMGDKSGLTYTVYFTRILAVDSDGKITSKKDDCYLEFTNGILTDVRL